MTGKELKQLLQPLETPQVAIAEMLHITPQAFQNKLKVKDVGSGLIETLCELLNVDITFFYPAYARTGDKAHVGRESQVLSREVNNNVRLLEEQIKTLKEQIRELQHDKEDLRAYIQVLSRHGND